MVNTLDPYKGETRLKTSDVMRVPKQKTSFFRMQTCCNARFSIPILRGTTCMHLALHSSVWTCMCALSERCRCIRVQLLAWLTIVNVDTVGQPQTARHTKQTTSSTHHRYQLCSIKEGIYTRQAIDVFNPHHLKHRTPMQQIIHVYCLPLSHASAVSICSLPFPASTRPKFTSAGDTPHREITFRSQNHQ